MKLFFKPLYLLLLITAVVNAQNTEIPSVFKFNTTHLHAIHQGNEVKGYLAYYTLDKKDKDHDNYILQFYDENLNEVGQKKLAVPKNQYFEGVEYDGNTIVTKFADTKAKTAIYTAYNGKAEETGKVTEPLSKSEAYRYIQYMKTAPQTAPNFYSIDGAGFVNYSNDPASKAAQYKIQFMNGDNIKTGWVYTPEKGASKYSGASYLSSSQNILLSITTGASSAMMAKDMVYSILALDVKTGKKLCEVACGNSTYNYAPVGAYIENDKFIVVGQFVGKKDNIVKAPSLGLSMVEYDFSGNIVSEKYTLWKDGLAKFAEMKGNKLMDGGYIYFHNIIKAADGNMVLVGEEFRKAANAAGIVNAALGGGYGGNFSKLIITDFLFLELSPQFDIISTKKIEKGETSFDFPGLDYMGSILAARLAVAMGYFDYDYTTYADDKSRFSVVYSDYDKLEGSKKPEVYVGNVTYDGKFTIDKVPYKRGVNASLYKIYAAKNGYFMMATYYKKTKKLDLNLIKFNN